MYLIECQGKDFDAEEGFIPYLLSRYTKFFNREKIR